MPEREHRVNGEGRAAPRGWYSRTVPPRPPPSAAALAGLLAALLAGLPVDGAPLRPGLPQLTLELEGQAAQPGGDRSRGFGLGLALAWRLTDQLSVTGAVTELVSRAGPVSTLGFGLRALLDSTPIAPFLEIQVVQLGPMATTGYQLATRIGGGADVRFSQAFAIGLAVRTLTPVDPSTLSTSPAAGLEVALRAVITPGFLR